MRERLDGVILDFGDVTNWCQQKEGSYAKGRLHLHRLARADTDTDNIYALADMAASLQRFDVCLLAICEENLAWIRQAMLAARPTLRVPIIGLVRNLKAAVIGDLYNLGMAAFVREPLCVEEIRIRTERVLDGPRIATAAGYAETQAIGPSAVQDGNKDYGHIALYQSNANGCTAAGVADSETNALSDTHIVRQPGDPELEAFAIASAVHCSSSNDSFGVAKSNVVGCFERAYLHASLAKSSGNIAMAARGAKKHRRAYWALMRKHNIDAAPYRNIAPPDQ